MLKFLIYKKEYIYIYNVSNVNYIFDWRKHAYTVFVEYGVLWWILVTG